MSPTEQRDRDEGCRRGDADRDVLAAQRQVDPRRDGGGKERNTT